MGKRPSVYCQSGFHWFKNQAGLHEPEAGGPENLESQLLPASAYGAFPVPDTQASV